MDHDLVAREQVPVEFCIEEFALILLPVATHCVAYRREHGSCGLDTPGDMSHAQSTLELVYELRRRGLKPPALLVVSSILAQLLPTTEEDKKAAQRDKALDYCSRAKAEIELLQRPAEIPDVLWTAEKNKLLATVDSSIRLVEANR